MSEVKALSQAQLEKETATLPNWKVKAGKLHAEFKFENFVDAFAFMTKVAITAEVSQHHPEWSNVYNRVTIDLVTHDADNSISQRDIDMARQIDTFAG